MPDSSFPAHAPAKSPKPPSLHGMQKLFIGAVEDEWGLYSDSAHDYTLGSIIGFGASSIVYSAVYQPRTEPRPAPIPCALKVLDLDKLPPHSLSLLQRETTLMSLSKHPNVIRVRGSWMDGHKLYIAMRLMHKGSAADVMRYGWPGGMEEDVVKCILRQALQGLNYLHINGFIHRDVKAANLLIDDDGTVLLADLGVAADLAEESSLVPQTGSRYRTITSATAALSEPTRQASLVHSIDASHSTSSSGKRVVVVEPPALPIRPKIGKRKSFVGTPCWMAPELIQGRQYDSSADIWSFGITALELTQGRPPRARESPQQVLLRTIQEDPPTLDREGGTFKYSRAFKEVVDSCLVKDPTKRPTAEQLLQTPFFKSAKKPSYLVGAILKDLPPLTQRQERRALPTPASHRTVDSWDFTTTVHTSSSIHRHRLRHDDDDDDGSYIGGTSDTRRGSIDSRPNDDPSSRTRYARSITWEEPCLAQPLAEEDAEPPPSSPSSPSEPGGFSQVGASSSPTTSIAPSSPPSSVNVSEERKPDAEYTSRSKPEPNDEYPPIVDIGECTITKKPDAPSPISQVPALPMPINRPPPSSFVSRIDTKQQQVHRPSTSHPSSASPSGSPSHPGAIWRKLKTNFVRPSTRGGHESPESLSSPRSSLFEGAQARLEAARLNAVSREQSPKTPEKEGRSPRSRLFARRPSTAATCQAHETPKMRSPLDQEMIDNWPLRRPDVAPQPVVYQAENAQKPDDKKMTIGRRFVRRASMSKFALVTATTRTAQAVGLMK